MLEVANSRDGYSFKENVTNHKIWYRYFVEFGHGISVFSSFSWGVGVLCTPQCPLCAAISVTATYQFKQITKPAFKDVIQ